MMSFSLRCLIFSMLTLTYLPTLSAQNFNHKQFSAMQCSQCHRTDSTQALSWVVARDEFVAASLMGSSAPNAEEVDRPLRCGEFVLAVLGDSLLRSHLHLEKRAALVVLQAPEKANTQVNLERGDLILDVDQEKVTLPIDLRNKMDQLAEKSVKLHLIRAGKELDCTIAANQLCSPPKTYLIGIQVEYPNDALRAQLGLFDNEGLQIIKVVDGSPAQTAGVQLHDIVTRVDGKRMSAFEELNNAVNQSGGRELELRLVRKSKEISIRVTPKAQPETELIATGAKGDTVQWDLCPIYRRVQLRP